LRLLEICTNYGPGGIQRHVLDLTAALRARGHHVVAAGSPGDWLPAGSDPEFLDVNLLDVIWEGGPLPRRLWYAALAARRLRSFLGHHHVDLIHAHESGPALVAWAAALGRGIPLVVTYHGSEPERIAGFGRVARSVATRVVTPSRRSARDLATIGGVPEAKLIVLGLGIARQPPPDPATVAALRAGLGVDGQSLLVVTVARLARQKGMDVLIDVVRRAIAMRPGLSFVVVGDGPLQQQVDGWARAAGVDRHLRFIGHSERPRDYLAAADLFLLTSRWEALPISIVEALRAGLPVVATDAGGVRELVDADVGAVVPIGDAAALAEALLRLCDDTVLRARCSANAARRGDEDRFDPEFVHAQFERFYRGILDSAAQRRAERG
jgi:glycosyltransferase involved in cell wall biosynthesis